MSLQLKVLSCLLSGILMFRRNSFARLLLKFAALKPVIGRFQLAKKSMVIVKDI